MRRGCVCVLAVTSAHVRACARPLDRGAATRNHARMLRRLTLAIALTFAVVAPALGCGGKPAPAAPSEARPAQLGAWREFWGVEGETDVTYHDEYEVAMSGGQPVVRPRNQEHPDDIRSVRIDGDAFDLVIHTSFDVHYQLRLDPGGDSMSGTATTPDKTVPIRWERIRE